MPDPPAVPDDVGTLDGIVQALYETVSFEPGAEPDWERLATLFHPDGRLIPPHGAGGELRPVLEVEEFARLSAEYAEESGLRDRGFYEREIGRRTERFRNVAHLFSAYESLNTPDDAESFSRGVNSIQLAWDRDRWWIFSVAWDVEGPEHPLPEDVIE